MNIWLVWDHEEHGPETLFACSSAEKALEAALSLYPNYEADIRERFPKEIDVNRHYQLTPDWGGPCVSMRILDAI